MKYFTILSLTIVSILLFSNCENNFVDLAAQAEEDETLINQYLEDNQIDAQRHESGLYYRIENAGSNGSPSINSEVQAKYKGYLLDGSVFDETDEEETRFFFLNRVIRGWQIGIPLLEKGGKGTFFVPSNLGYGGQARPGIPSFSVLIFEVELINYQ